jgi:hypothetical protein
MSNFPDNVVPLFGVRVQNNNLSEELQEISREIAEVSRAVRETMLDDTHNPEETVDYPGKERMDAFLAGVADLSKQHGIDAFTVVALVAHGEDSGQVAGLTGGLTELDLDSFKDVVSYMKVEAETLWHNDIFDMTEKRNR